MEKRIIDWKGENIEGIKHPHVSDVKYVKPVVTIPNCLPTIYVTSNYCCSWIAGYWSSLVLWIIKASTRITAIVEPVESSVCRTLIQYTYTNVL